MIRRPSKPGLFVTGTDTGVGKTVVACAVAAVLHGRGVTVGVCKPVATGCRRDREGLISEDAEALAHFSDCRLPLAAINPIRYHVPLAPAVAAERETAEGDEAALAGAMGQIERASEVVIVEGVGGVLTPIDDKKTVLDLMVEIGYPVLVVSRATLGTLNHTAMTCRIVRDAGLQIAGIVINRYHADTIDLAETTNPRWLAKQNGVQVLATVPEASGVAAERAALPAEVIEAVNVVDWLSVCRVPVAK